MPTLFNLFLNSIPIFQFSLFSIITYCSLVSVSTILDKFGLLCSAYITSTLNDLIACFVPILFIIVLIFVFPKRFSRLTLPLIWLLRTSLYFDFGLDFKAYGPCPCSAKKVFLFSSFMPYFQPNKIYKKKRQEIGGDKFHWNNLAYFTHLV